MGAGRWDPTDWSNFSKTVAAKSTAQIFTSCAMDPDLDPTRCKMRESCDSDDNPNSTPVIIAIDETGSMGELAGHLIREDLGVLIEEIYDRKPVSDPHVMCMAIGDAYCGDRAPLQVTQFEADTRLIQQLNKFYLEGGGGGNGGESYNLPWYFAQYRTKCDSQIKRNKKGYLFTVGDEAPHGVLTKEAIKQFVGDTVEQDIQTRDLYTAVSKNWEVFHLMVMQGAGCSQDVQRRWKDLLGERAIELTDHTELAKVIVSIMQVIEGAAVSAVVSSWSGNTALVVRNAISSLSPSTAGTSGVTRL